MSPPTHLPGLVPAVARGHAIGSSSDRRLAVAYLFLAALLFLGGIVRTVMLGEAVGPLITLVVWCALFVWKARKRGVFAMELFAVLGCIVVLQLLLDMLSPHLGDIIIAGLHVLYVAAVLVDRLRCNRDRPGRDHE